MAQNALVSLQDEIKNELQNVNETVAGSSNPRISTKGKVFTLPTGESSPGPMDLIIIGYINVNLLYEGRYDPQNPQPPACFAINRNVKEMVPSTNSPAKKADACNGCDNNKWGSSPVGKGKACKNTMRLAVVPPDATEDSDIYLLDVSPTGLTNFGSYVQRLANSRTPALPLQVVTTVKFDPNVDFPKLQFELKERVTDEQLAVVAALRPMAQSMLEREPSLGD